MAATAIPGAFDRFAGFTCVQRDARAVRSRLIVLERMLARVGMDAATGAVPVAGDIFDFLYRSNSGNVRAMLAHVERQHPGARLIDGVQP